MRPGGQATMAPNLLRLSCTLGPAGGPLRKSHPHRSMHETRCYITTDAHQREDSRRDFINKRG